MRYVIAVVLLALLAGCGEAAVTSKSQYVETARCRSAMSEMVGIAEQTQREALDGSLTARGGSVRGAAINSAIKAAHVPCSSAIDRALTFAAYQLALATAQLQICDVKPNNCDPNARDAALSDTASALRKFVTATKAKRPSPTA